MRIWPLIALLFAIFTGCGMPPMGGAPWIDEDESDTFANAADGNLTVVFIDVGQGDATLIIAPHGEAILIDAGPAGAGASAVIPALERHGVHGLTAIVATHYHADHIGGIPEVISGPDGARGTADDLIPANGVIDRGGQYEGSSPAWSAYLAAAGTLRHAVYPGDRIDGGNVAISVVAAGGAASDGTTVPLDPADENAASIALVIEYGDVRVFIGGDLTGGGGTPPYDTVDLETPVGAIVGDVDVLQVNHHGSTTATNAAFLAALMPQIAVISCGDDNDHYHPHRSVIERLLDAGIDIYQTEECWTDDDADVTIAHGDIILTTDGIQPPSITIN